MSRRVGVHRCRTCDREWRYTTVVGGLLKLVLGALHVWWFHPDDDNEVGPTTGLHERPA